LLLDGAPVDRAGHHRDRQEHQEPCETKLPECTRRQSHRSSREWTGCDIYGLLTSDAAAANTFCLHPPSRSSAVTGAAVPRSCSSWFGRRKNETPLNRVPGRLSPPSLTELPGYPRTARRLHHGQAERRRSITPNSVRRVADSSSNVKDLRVALSWALRIGVNQISPARARRRAVRVRQWRQGSGPLDAATGDLLWQYDRRLPTGVAPETGRYLRSGDVGREAGLPNVVTRIDPKTGAKIVDQSLVPGDGRTKMPARAPSRHTGDDRLRACFLFAESGSQSLSSSKQVARLGTFILLSRKNARIASAPPW
jgi:hypothetical protein